MHKIIINQTQMLLFQIKEYEKQYTTKIDEVKQLENKITKTKAKISKLTHLKTHPTSSTKIKN